MEPETLRLHGLLQTNIETGSSLPQRRHRIPSLAKRRLPLSVYSQEAGCSCAGRIRPRASRLHPLQERNSAFPTSSAREFRGVLSDMRLRSLACPRSDQFCPGSSLALASLIAS